MNEHMNQLNLYGVGSAGRATTSIHDVAGLETLLRYLLILSTATIPLLVPPLPGNSVAVDVVNFALIGFGALWIAPREVRLPLLVPVFMVVLGGFMATTQSADVVRSLLALAQDIYLFALFIIVFNLLLQDRSGRVGRAIASTWSIVGIGSGAIVWFCGAVGLDFFLGARMVDPYGRAHGPLRDPNMAGVYLVMSLFVMWMSPWPRRVPTKLAASVPFILGIQATKSNTALFTLLGGAIAVWAVTLIARRRSRPERLAMTIVLTGVIALFVLLLPDVAGLADRSVHALGDTSAFKGSLGRIDESTGPRIDRWGESLALFQSELAVGIGPSATNEWLETIHARIGGEIHSDYVAGFLERGVLGGIGNLLLLGSLLLWTLRLAFNDRLRREGWFPAAALGATVALLMAANALETLHFRHMWLLAALVIGLQMSFKEQAESEGPPLRRSPDP